ncbi:MAG: hypothetical protein JSR56_12995, partial [Proteobacteria bacterium]|nr:hypothetical protein [Pseudomonadota bacterium]
MSRTVSRHWDRACSYLRDRQLPAAKAQLESLRALAPEDARTVLLSARIAWQDDHVRVAAGTAVDAGHAAPEDAGLLCEVIDTLLETGETTAAHGLLDRPAWSQTDSVDALLRYANFRQDFSEQAAALAAL